MFTTEYSVMSTYISRCCCCTVDLPPSSGIWNQSTSIVRRSDDLVFVLCCTLYLLQTSGQADSERAAHAMADPEIQMILSDPMVRQVLNDFKENPPHAQKVITEKLPCALIRVPTQCVDMGMIAC